MRLLSVLILSIFLAIQNEPDDRKGIAMGYLNSVDAEMVNASWYYVYGSCDASKCVPMSRDGEDPQLPADYAGYVLLFNEPNNVEPYGHPVSPADAVNIYKALREEYSGAKWVVGNVIFWGGWNDWLYEFRDLCITQDIRLPEAWGVHIYISGTSGDWIPYIRSEMAQLHADLVGEFWVTEFAEVKGNIITDKAMEDYFNSQGWITHYAYFTNRANGSDAWYPAGWDVALFDWDSGLLTNIGRWYSDQLYYIYLPLQMAS